MMNHARMWCCLMLALLLSVSGCFGDRSNDIKYDFMGRFEVSSCGRYAAVWVHRGSDAAEIVIYDLDARAIKHRLTDVSLFGMSSFAWDHDRPVLNYLATSVVPRSATISQYTAGEGTITPIGTARLLIRQLHNLEQDLFGWINGGVLYFRRFSESTDLLVMKNVQRWASVPDGAIVIYEGGGTTRFARVSLAGDILSEIDISRDEQCREIYLELSKDRQTAMVSDVCGLRMIDIATMTVVDEIAGYIPYPMSLSEQSGAYIEFGHDDAGAFLLAFDRWSHKLGEWQFTESIKEVHARNDTEILGNVGSSLVGIDIASGEVVTYWNVTQ